jgi:hypothetical protein
MIVYLSAPCSVPKYIVCTLFLYTVDWEILVIKNFLLTIFSDENQTPRNILCALVSTLCTAYARVCDDNLDYAKF